MGKSSVFWRIHGMKLESKLTWFILGSFTLCLTVILILELKKGAETHGGGAQGANIGSYSGKLEKRMNESVASDDGLEVSLADAKASRRGKGGEGSDTNGKAIFKRDNGALRVYVTRDGYFHMALGDDSADLYTADEEIFMPKQPGGVPRGVFIKLRNKESGEILTARDSSAGWYTPLIYSSGVVIHRPNAFRRIPRGLRSGEVKIENLLVLFEENSGRLPQMEELELKLRFVPAVMAIVDGVDRKPLPENFIIETDWLDGSILKD
jgi:hypothetical protein